MHGLPAPSDAERQGSPVAILPGTQESSIHGCGRESVIPADSTDDDGDCRNVQPARPPPTADSIHRSAYRASDESTYTSNDGRSSSRWNSAVIPANPARTARPVGNTAGWASTPVACASTSRVSGPVTVKTRQASGDQDHRAERAGDRRLQPFEPVHLLVRRDADQPLVRSEAEHGDGAVPRRESGRPRQGDAERRLHRRRPFRADPEAHQRRPHGTGDLDPVAHPLSPASARRRGRRSTAGSPAPARAGRWRRSPPARRSAAGRRPAPRARWRARRSGCDRPERRIR